MNSPSRASASWCGPRAMSVTSAPPRASMPPKKEPTAPAPITAIRCMTPPPFGLTAPIASSRTHGLRPHHLSEMVTKLAKARNDQQLPRAVLQFHQFLLPGAGMGYQGRVQPGLQGGQDVAVRAISHQPPL